MKLIAGLVSMVLVMLCCREVWAGTPVSVEARIEAAEAEYARGVYGKAHELYESIAALELDEETRRWVSFRVADSGWRALAGTAQVDESKFDPFQQALVRLVEDHYQREPARDRTYAGITESLGDFWWLRDGRRYRYTWGNAQPWYQRALEYWAASTDIDEARARYLGIVMGVYDAAEAQGYGRGYVFFEPSVLQDAMEIAVDDRDVARMAYLYASAMQQRGMTYVINRRTIEAYEKAVALGQGTAWYDDALHAYGMYLAHQGRVEVSDEGYVQAKPDYVRALEIFRTLVRTFQKGESRYADDARAMIEEITRPYGIVTAEQAFLPGSRTRFHVDWRNTGRVTVRMHRVDLTAKLDLSDREAAHEWLMNLRIDGDAPVRTWTIETGDAGEHQPGRETVTLEEPLAPGAYVLEAMGGSRELLLVSDLAAVVKSSPTQMLVYVCDALTGEPAAGATVAATLSYQQSHGRWSHVRVDGMTDDLGLVMFDSGVLGREGHAAVFVAARSGDRQTLQISNMWSGQTADNSWKLYAYTDRPAYRPGETVQWRLVARDRENGRYTTPEGQSLQYEIFSPQGEKVQEGTLALDAFGAASASLELTSEMQLGEYRVHFRRPGTTPILGGATLFRLEEYKLPEFLVRVEPPRGDDGQLKRTIMGEVVEVDVVAEFYFGGPVIGAEVEAIVYQKPFYHGWQPRREFPWLREQDRGGPWYGWGWKGEEVKRQTVRTDEEGRATIRIETPEYAEQDLEYTLECRVTDASRREVTSEQSVRVTRQSYFVYATPEHRLRRPGDEIGVTFKALDANQNPVSDAGKVKIERLVWKELWRLPDGTEITGSQMSALRARGEVSFMWQPFFIGYEIEELDVREARTDAEGEAVVTYRAAKEGYYRFTWLSRDPGRGLIEGSTTVWVADEATESVGYHADGVDIIVDDATFREGERAPLMITTPVSGRWVLFTVEAESILSYQVIRMEGTAKLTHVDLADEHIPNVWFSASVVSDATISRDQEYVVVPPTKHFLEVEVTTDQPSYEPREEGTLQVRTTDEHGKPVSASVSVALVDDSVFAIQSDYAGDPRQFFYGQTRPRRIWDSSSFDWRRYARLPSREEELQDETRRREAGEFSRGMREAETTTALATESRLGFAPAAPASEVMSDMGVNERLSAKRVGRDASMDDGGALGQAPPMGGVGGAAGGEDPVVQVRSDFRSTIAWLPSVVTDERGMASVDVTFPDNLTRWRATARAVTKGTDVGSAEAEMRTRLPLTARLQAPRFFVVGDELVISTILNNNSEAALSVDARLEVEGLTRIDDEIRRGLEIEAGGERRVDWRVRVTEASGEALLRTTATSRSGDGYSDAMEKTYPVHEHGIDKFLASSGRTTGEGRIELRLPHERRPGSTTLNVQVTPSLAVTMLDALPYLIRYPYGCTEQTMSRFMPAAITARTLRDMGLHTEDVAGRLFGGLEPEHVGATQRREPALDQMNAVIEASLKRLSDFQHGDGGWGWWKEGDSDRYMSAYVVWGLSVVAEAGIDFDREMLRRGAEYLRTNLVEEERVPAMQAWMLHALGQAHVALDSDISRFERTALDNLWEGRGRLNAYGAALAALAYHAYGEKERAALLIEVIAGSAQVDEHPDLSAVMRGGQEANPHAVKTAHWGADGFWYRWWDSPVESTSFVLMAMAKVSPRHELVEPTMMWLVRNRRGAQWSNTRDTSIAVLALNTYIKASGETVRTVSYQVEVNGQKVAERTLAPEDIIAAPSTFEVDEALIRDSNEIVIRSTYEDGSAAPLFYMASSSFFSLEEPIEAAGHEIFIRRQYYRVVATPTLLNGVVEKRVPLNDGDIVRSGERVDVVLSIETRNDYEYLLIEDLKPAGFEAVDVKSGGALFAQMLTEAAAKLRFGSATEKADASAEWKAGEDRRDYTGRRTWIYRELRDRQVALFASWMGQGVWEVQYTLRAEIPGAFHALPVTAHAMYVPEIRCNGREVRVTVLDRE